VDAAEVIEREPARHRSPVILPLFAEGVRQSRESARTHTDAEIGPLHNRSANVLGIGTTHDWNDLHGGDFCGAVTLLSVLGSAIDLDELGEVAAVRATSW
jgi:hypothetical protein